MKRLLKDKYNTIEDYMSDSNVGGRKGRGIRDHLFVVNGIIHDTMSSKTKKSITIQQIDYSFCFDSMWQDQDIIDLHQAGLNDDKLALLYELNKKNNVAVRTSNGLSDRKKH